MGQRSRHTAQERDAFFGVKSAYQSQINSKGPCEDAGGNRYKSIYISISTVNRVLYRHNLKGYVWRKKGEAYKLKNIQTVKHGVGSIILWGCFTAGGAGALHKIDAITRMENYVDILKQHLSQEVKAWLQMGLPN